jgi:hypothetical protein
MSIRKKLITMAVLASFIMLFTVQLHAMVGAVNVSINNNGETIATASVGVWMFKDDEMTIDAIADWMEMYDDDDAGPLFEPINIIWFDLDATSSSTATSHVDDFLDDDCSFNHSWMHSSGYYGYFDANWISQYPSGRCYTNGSFYETNDHGRLFSGHLPANRIETVYYSSAAFSREDYKNFKHTYNSFNNARTAVYNAGGNSANWDYIGKIYLYNKAGDSNNSDYDFQTGDHDGYAICYGRSSSSALPKNASSITIETEPVLLSVTGIDNEEISVLPKSFSLAQNYPNPFNPTTTISYSIPESENVKLTIYNVNGQLIKTLVNEQKDAGSYNTLWNGKDESGNSVSSGVYFYRIKAGDFTTAKRMLLVK